MSRVDPRRQLEQCGKILQAAASLIASEGYHGMSMRSLAKASGHSVPRPLLEAIGCGDGGVRREI